MSLSDQLRVLNRLLAIVHRSLPMYLAEAGPWTHAGDEQAVRVLGAILTDAKHYAQRIAEMILAHRGALDLGEFPMEFTDLNMLSLDFLLTELVRWGRQDIGKIESCVAALPIGTKARALAEEVLGNARGHLESLEELLKRPNPGGLRIAAT
jgi:hypothetical protein